MEHAEYVYTVGMDRSELDECLRDGEHGILALADGDDAYAVPLSYHYDGDRILLRVSSQGDGGEKTRFLETTDTATFVRYDASNSDSWSIHIQGAIHPWSEDVDEATLNEWFPPFRIFDESIEDVEFTLYELVLESVVGRRTTSVSE